MDLTLDSTPLYYTEETGCLLFPKDMIMVSFNNTLQLSKISYFSKIEQDENLSTIIEKRDKRTYIDNCIIYDGKDLYVFLQNETITIGDKEYKISPLSYVKVKYQEFIEIYNYDKDEDIYIQEEDIVNEDVIIKSQYYTLNLTTDSIKYGDSEQLLISNPENLPLAQ